MRTLLNISLSFKYLGSPKTYGKWTNLGECVKHQECKWCVSTGGSNITCGPGVQQQIRTCQDGNDGGGDVDVKSDQICTTADKLRIIDCLISKCPEEENESNKGESGGTLAIKAAGNC